MVKLSAVSGQSVPVVVTVSGVELSLKVRPHVMTPARELRMQELSGPEAVGELLAFFCDYVAEWDLTDDDDVPIGIRPEVVGSVLPSSVMLAMLAQAQEQVTELGK